MSGACPNDAPVELSDGTIVQPDDTVRLRDLCEIVPLILETMAASAAAGAPGAPGKVAPGSSVPVVGQMPGFSSPVAPGFGARPGAIAPAMGPAGMPAQSGGGGFGGGGGGGRGPAGPPGPRGPAGPAGPGTIAPPIAKVDGDFTVAFTSPFVPVPGTSIAFTQQADGTAILFLQAVFGSAGFGTNGQVGIRVDGIDYPLTANLMHTFASGVGQFLVSAVALLPVTLAAGAHTAEVVLRGDASLYAPIGAPVTIQANPLIPLHFAVVHG